MPPWPRIHTGSDHGPAGSSEVTKKLPPPLMLVVIM